MIISITYKCDWPECDHTISCEPNTFFLYNWEGKNKVKNKYTKHLCPNHRDRNLNKALKKYINQGIILK